jgi:hypothetical protein
MYRQPSLFDRLLNDGMPFEHIDGSVNVEFSDTRSARIIIGEGVEFGPVFPAQPSPSSAFLPLVSGGYL